MDNPVKTLQEPACSHLVPFMKLACPHPSLSPASNPTMAKQFFAASTKTGKSRQDLNPETTRSNPRPYPDSIFLFPYAERPNPPNTSASRHLQIAPCATLKCSVPTRPCATFPVYGAAKQLQIACMLQCSTAGGKVSCRTHTVSDM